MDIREFIFVIDISAIVTMLFLSYLSRRLGEALKIRPYYVALYACALLVFFAFAGDTVSLYKGSNITVVTYPVRACAAVVSVIVVLRYWQWLFSEYFKK